MKETRIFASPFDMVEQTKEERLQWAEDNGMVWSVMWFISSINCDMINTDKYQFDSYETSDDSISVPIYYYEDDDNEKVYDVEEMTKEFETKLYQLERK